MTERTFAQPQIQKGITIPPRGSDARKLKPSFWGFIREMEFGDSFLIQSDEVEKQPNPYYWQESIRAIGRRYGITLTSRIVKEGVRFWCVKRHPLA